MDTTAYEQSHLPGAVGWNWTSQLADGIRRDIAGREDFSKLLSESGIGPDTTVVLYGDKGITPDKDVIAYCRIGERSSHTWFVLHELLGFERVRNYDGSWTEWGSMVGMPIEKPVPAVV